MKKYIVTGGLGFIGSHLTEKLLASGNKVVVIDNESTGFRSNLSTVLNNPNLTILNASIDKWEEISKLFAYFQGADGVFHLAAVARIQPSIYSPLETHHSNVTGTLHVLEMMRMCKIESIVYSASSSYYGRQTAHRALKETDAGDCQTPYAISKYMGEMYCKTWGKLHGIRNACLRYFNAYGRRSPLAGPYAPVIGIFFRQAITNNPITVIGDGEQRRDFTHVNDVVRANIAAMEKLNSDNWKVLSGLTLNIGTGQNYTINEVAAIIRTTLLSGGIANIKITNVPERIGEARFSLADNALAQEIINWQPEVDLLNGIEDLKNYYLNNLEQFSKGTFRL